MNNTCYHFTLGTFKCVVVNDGSLSYTKPASAHFANAPVDQLAQALLKYNIKLDQWEEWLSPLPCLLIQTGKHQILVDTGLGHVDFGPNAGNLLHNLQSEGIHPGDIDTVILTHAHGDHIGGNVDLNGSPAFPNARYIMRKEEWDFWTSEKTLSQPEHEWMTSFTNQQLLPLSSRFELIERDTEIVPGVRTLFAPGHTPGNMVLDITSDGEKLICLGDVITHPIHLEQPDWHLEPDCDPILSVNTRRELLGYASRTHALVFAFHMDFPGLGYVNQQGEAWRWQPILASME